MKRSKDEIKEYLSFATFFPTLIMVVLINVISVMIFMRDIDFRNIQLNNAILLTLFWMITSCLLTILIRYNAIHRYERPMKKLAKATKEVANGDFSVYVDPNHTIDSLDYLDRMILDFNKMVEELGSVETLKTDFFSNVSHEIKTPLAIIQNYAEQLKNDDLPQSLKTEYIDTIYETSKRLSSLITNILKLNKLEKQSIILHHEPYDVSRQLCDCILSFENLWDKKKIELEVDIEDRRLISLDVSLMELVWNNLLSNAIKFTPEKGHILIKEYVENNICYVSIQDNGCGMSPETTQHIFEKFYQGDTSHATQGNGLGLALAQRVVQLSGASIHVSSELGIGTTFWVEIPVIKELDVMA